MLFRSLFVEAEVEFVDLYENQPLFPEISAELATKGLVFMEFLHMYRWQPTTLDGTGQLVFADALFARAPEDVARADELTIRRYSAAVAMYSRGDLLTRLHRELSPGILASQVDALARQVSREVGNQKRRTDFLGRVLRRWDSNSQGHLLY